ncbi:MAG: dihydropteroate synthase [Saccharospirillaceae bacterium]|nr:dihydropteroate synthase [Pseudomonadales bacterium]NRB78797.1 dihydropteroate synthase [Saccharospirillaceae bacterium]
MQKNALTILGLPPKSTSIMGILNVTPDSFSDGGKFNDIDKALQHAEQMLAGGADIIDIGGESTRPNATKVNNNEELKRVIPVIEAIKKRFNCLISVDSSNPNVIWQAYNAGVDLINDVRALSQDNALEVSAKTGLPVCLMHMQGAPDTMQLKPKYDNIVQDVTDFFEFKINQCYNAGIDKHKIILDVGFGFGKTLEHNLQMLNSLEQFHKLELPLLVGLSRKSMLGQITGQPEDQRLHSSISAGIISAMKGAQILRVHDVPQTKQALQIVEAMNKVKYES